MHQEKLLKNRMKQRKLSHAYTIIGENRKELADTLAAALVCTGEEPPCGGCSGCRKATQGIHPDIIRADAEGEGLKAEQVRKLRSDAYILPNEAPRKVYILEHAELLNPTGQNVLLKLIEEGPSYAAFLFLTPNPELLLPTIRSRCETIRAMGEETEAAAEEGLQLAALILNRPSPADALPFFLSLEKKKREEIELILETTTAQLVARLPEQPTLLPVLEELRSIQAACAFNISSGHLVGWLLSVSHR